MPKTTLNPEGLPVPRGSYSLVATAQPGRMVFIAGTLWLADDFGAIKHDPLT